MLDFEHRYNRGLQDLLRRTSLGIDRQFRVYFENKEGRHNKFGKALFERNKS